MTKKTVLCILLRWGIFLLLFIFICIMIEPMFSSSTSAVINQIGAETILNRPGQWDVLFVGSSHVYRAIQPELIKQIVPVESAVLWLPGSDTRNSYFFLKKAVRAGKIPKLVVLDSFSMIMQSSMHLLALPLEDKLLIVKDAIQLFPPEDHLSRIGILSANHANWKNIKAFKQVVAEYFRFYLQNPDDQEVEEVLKSHARRSISRTASMVQYDLKQKLSVSPLTDYSVYQFLRLIAYCRQQGIRLVIVDFPTLNNTRVPMEKVTQLAQENNIPLYDFGKVFRRSYPHRHVLFREGGPNSHLNQNGALLFTPMISRVIAQDLGLPYDENSAREVTQLVQISLRLEGLEDKNSEEITFTLVPLNPDLPLKYSWALENRKGEKVLETKGKKNYFTIPRMYWNLKNYSVEVRISEQSLPDKELLLSIPCS